MSRVPTQEAIRRIMDDDYGLITKEERTAYMAESTDTPSKREDRVRRKNMTRMGKREELAIVKLLEPLKGIRARRVPGSGAIEGTEDCDILLDVLDYTGDYDYEPSRLTVEVKARKTCGWKTLEKWRSGADVLVLVEMQQKPGQKKEQPRVYMDWALFSWLLERAARP